MRREFYIAEAQVKDGPLHRYLIHPNLRQIDEDSRSLDEMLTGAQKKGYESRYCSSYHGVSSQFAEEVRKALVKRLKVKYADIRSEWDVEIDLKARVVDYGEEISRQNRENWKL